ncbi:helix-turn-helix domain-containing protein [Actinoplanes sp. N902-109]|uniref:helix-turn-helix domain-containing protein n=1 Tax=Actinoplanes sp. (strain N902-109) TaxID=649831 RepID=UPI0003295280|nr:helix-turn-helix domain-containing protein [Actinoplanes sp. N902-109]AGL14400.1 phage excisionase [Actinoplanes sp. N902-109]
MDDGLYSVEQVADQLGLHVRTVRGYIRDGKLPAVRIGKQYRIAQPDLDALTGRPAAPAPRIEVSAVAEVTAIGTAGADRLSTLLVAAAQSRRDLRVRTIHDETRRTLKVIVLGSPAATAETIRLLDETVTAL